MMSPRQLTIPACDRRRTPRYRPRCLRCARLLPERTACPRCAPELAPGQRWADRSGGVHEIAASRGGRVLLRWEGGHSGWLGAWFVRQLAAEGRWVRVESAAAGGGVP